MLPDRVSNPGPLTYEPGALPIALRGPARCRSTKLFAIIYLNLEIYYIVREKLSNIFSYCALANNVIHSTDAIHI